MDIILLEIDGRLQTDPGTLRSEPADVIVGIIPGRIEFDKVAKVRPANSPAVRFSRRNP